MPKPELLGLSYADCALAVEAAPADLAWLREQLCPHFHLRDPDGAAFRVRLRADADRHARYHRARPAQPARLCAHLLDSGALFHDSWQCDGRHVVHDDFFDVFCLPEAGGVCLLDTGGSPARPARPGRIPLLRAVREPAMHAAWRTGSLLLHAAAVASDAGVLAFAGRKRAGKSTLLAACLAACERLRFVANDRLCLLPDGRARGLPSIVSLRPGTLELVAALGARLRASHYLHNHSLAECAALEPALAAWQDGRFGISQSQLCRLLERQPQAEGRLAGVVFPRLQPAQQGLRLRRLETAEAGQRLAGSLLADAAAGARSALFDVPLAGEFPTQAQLQARAADLGAALPCFELTLGQGSSHDHAGLQRMLRACGL